MRVARRVRVWPLRSSASPACRRQPLPAAHRPRDRHGSFTSADDAIAAALLLLQPLLLRLHPAVRPRRPADVRADGRGRKSTVDRTANVPVPDGISLFRACQRCSAAAAVAAALVAIDRILSLRQRTSFQQSTTNPQRGYRKSSVPYVAMSPPSSATSLDVHLAVIGTDKKLCE